MPPPPEFDAAERAAIVVEYDRLAAEPKLPNFSSIGCMSFILSGVILLTFPRFGAGWPYAINLFVLILIALLAGGGLLMFFFGPDRGYERAKLRANAALELLSHRFAGTPADERRNAAVAAIFYGMYTNAFSSKTTYGSVNAAGRLGEALRYVQAVERVLLAERAPYPIFTDPLDKETERSRDAS